MAVELKRIGWKDEPSEDTPIDSGNLKQMENNTQEAITEVEKKDILAVGFNGDTSITSSNWQQKDLVFNKNIAQIGKNLTLANGKIRIGAGIKKIKASLQTTVSKLANDTFYDVQLNKNSEKVVTCSGKRAGDPQSWSFTIVPAIIEVKEGDLISVSAFVNSATFSTLTQFVVEVIEYGV